MFRDVRLLLATAALSFVWPAVAAGQGTGIGVSVQGTIGTHYADGGDTQSIGLDISFNEHFGIVVNAERSHVPTDVTFYGDGGYAATRGATTRFVSAEFRYVPVTYKRISPYVLGLIGRGVSRPNVNELFPGRVEHAVTLVGPGFGARVHLTDHLSTFADLRLMIQSYEGVPDAGGFGPLRAGLAWRF